MERWKVKTSDVPNPKNLPMILQVWIRGPVDKPHADDAPDPHGWAYVAPIFRAHLAVCSKCRQFLADKLRETAVEIENIGRPGITL